MTAANMVAKAIPAGLAGACIRTAPRPRSGCVMNEEHASSQSGRANVRQAELKAAMTRWSAAPFGRSSRCETPLTGWLKSLTECRLAVTVTFGTGRGSATTTPSQRTVEEIVRKAIKWVNGKCYGNGVKRKGYSIGAVAAIEGTGQFERIHVHIAFEPPPDMLLKQFIRLLNQAFRRSKWIEQRPYVVECWSQDWINYSLKLGQEALLPFSCLTPKHPGA